MKLLSIPVLVALLTSLPAQAAPIPHFRTGESYDQVRRSLLRAGWEPVRLVPAGHCGWDADQCPAVPEVVMCAGAGALVPCFYAWKKGGTFIEIEGHGEGVPQPYLRTIRCTGFIKGDPRFDNDWTCAK